MEVKTRRNLYKHMFLFVRKCEFVISDTVIVRSPRSVEEEILLGWAERKFPSFGYALARSAGVVYKQFG
jgi:hypothetical protein